MRPSIGELICCPTQLQARVVRYTLVGFEGAFGRVDCRLVALHDSPSIIDCFLVGLNGGIGGGSICIVLGPTARD